MDTERESIEMSSECAYSSKVCLVAIVDTYIDQKHGVGHVFLVYMSYLNR